jgi:hypothetical protein
VGGVALKFPLRISVCALALMFVAFVHAAGDKPYAAAPAFYRDVLPILQKHCQQCHRAGEIAPMPLVSYQDARPWARLIARNTTTKRMPPWFADPCCGHFADDPSLTDKADAKGGSDSLRR